MKFGPYWQCVCLGHSDAYENGSSGDTIEDLMLDIHDSRKPHNDHLQSTQQVRLSSIQDNEYYHSLWSNSSR